MHGIPLCDMGGLKEPSIRNLNRTQSVKRIFESSQSDIQAAKHFLSVVSQKLSDHSSAIARYTGTSWYVAWRITHDGQRLCKAVRKYLNATCSLIATSPDRADTATREPDFFAEYANLGGL
jgi:hypothetical protein